MWAKNNPDVPKYLTDRQKEVISGWLLSDGNLSKYSSTGNARFSLSQSKFPRNKPERTETITWTFNELTPFSTRVSERICKPSKRVSKCTSRIEVWTCNHAAFTMLHQQWYQETNGKFVKHVPDNLSLTPLSLSLWAMGDGINRPKKRHYVFCTDSFTEHDVDMLIISLNKLGIKGTKFRHSSNGLRIGVSGDFNYYNLIKTIEPHTLSCFAYKADLSCYTKANYKTNEKIKVSEGHVDWIIEKWSMGYTTQAIASAFGCKFGINVSHGSISNALKKVNGAKNLKKGRKQKLDLSPIDYV